MKLPAHTNGTLGNDVTYFPTVVQSEDSNLLLTCQMIHLYRHFEQFHRWPRVAYIVVDSKSTNACYNAVSLSVELVRLSGLGIEEVYMMFTEPGHHCMHIEHMHSRLGGFFSSAELLDSLDAFKDALDGQTHRSANFHVVPTSWVYNFTARYKNLVIKASKESCRISEASLVHITKDRLLVYSEPMTDKCYPAELNLPPNKITEIKDWFLSAPLELAAPWLPPEKIPSVAEYKSWVKATPLCKSLHKMLAKMTLTDPDTGRGNDFPGRTSSTPELPLFWTQPLYQGNEAFRDPLRPAGGELVYDAGRATFLLVALAPITAEEPTYGEVYVCHLRGFDASTRLAALSTLNTTSPHVERAAVLLPDHEGNLFVVGGWRRVDDQLAACILHSPPARFSVARPARAPGLAESDAEAGIQPPPAKRTKHN